MIIEIRAPREGDAEELLANIRPADVAESEALHGPGRLANSLLVGMERSTLLWTGTADGEVGCIFGVAPRSMIGGEGIPWLVGTPLIDKHRGLFIRHNRAYIARMLAAFPHLKNVVDARNLKSIAWLRRMGFTVHDPVPLGFAGLPFSLFTMDA